MITFEANERYFWSLSSYLAQSVCVYFLTETKLHLKIEFA